MSSMRVAVASKDNKAINEHFGHAKHFYVYALEDGKFRFMENRQVPHYCLGGHSDKSAMPRILETIEDCAAVFVARIGDGPTEKLAKKGIKAVVDYPWEEIDSALRDYVDKL